MEYCLKFLVSLFQSVIKDILNAFKNVHHNCFLDFGIIMVKKNYMIDFIKNKYLQIFVVKIEI